ncbi:MAG TPA: peptide-methionine (S)-S-oxide reductase MsrA [Candidatus Acidoferrales bacterium]|nr:peptide-methionine (S)-S-oxide reductase MsrA [Candidatus Acidoferrales bacterium]
MSFRPLLAPLAATFLLAALTTAAGTALADAPAAKPAAHKTALATFAGGCFWSMETQFDGFRGVRNLTVGYCGGTTQHPTYEDVSTETTGHMETLQIEYDPALVTYDQLLDRYWHSIDPTQADGQFCDIGESYHSAIFVHDDAQRAAALASKARLEKSGVLHAPIATRILPAATFWPAEDYHQHYARKNPERYRDYREGCGRDAHSQRIWGSAWAKPLTE